MAAFPTHSRAQTWSFQHRYKAQYVYQKAADVNTSEEFPAHFGGTALGAPDFFPGFFHVGILLHRPTGLIFGDYGFRSRAAISMMIKPANVTNQKHQC